ncbi:hypothetical protein C0583_04495 [Candidatus Parcubacteria bacterium]|nr:MAG: hypothetical protein C0583_04495 [Candidatus Parcubacteria bacterium]
MVKELKEKIEQAVKGRMSPGCSVLVMKKGKELFRLSTGTFSDTDATVVTSDTLFDLASITKLYTSAIILTAKEEGKLSTLDKVAKYLPVFENSELTIQDLMTHQANFEIRLSEYRDKYQNSFGVEILKVVPPIKATEDVHYENITYLFLGQLIETVYQKPLRATFSDFFRTHDLLNTKLGSSDKEKLASPPTEVRNGEIVQGYTHDESADLMGGIAGNAGVFASTNDLAKFGRLWLEEKIVSNDNLKKVFTDYSKAGTRSQGLGWHQDLYGQSTKDWGVYLHAGYTGGLLAVHPSSSTVCAFNCNRTYYGRDNIKHREILKMLAEHISK